MKNKEYNMDKWYATAQKVVEEGAILLKNDNNVLPLGKGKTAVFGYAQLEPASFSVTKRDFVDALCDRGCNVDEDLHERYKAAGFDNRKYRTRTPVTMIDKEIKFSTEELRQIKDNGAETAIFVIGRSSGENQDVMAEEGGYYLSADEKNLIKNICSVFDKVAVILSIVCNIDLEFMDDNKIDAVLYVNKLRDMGAEGVARILCGDVNPSGKLTFTMARHLEDYPSTKYFGEHGGGLVQDYVEDIFVGYRYFDTFDKNDSVVWPFGFGLSYTSFDIKPVSFETGEKIKIAAEVTNTGDCAGKEVVQVYFAPPQMKNGAKLGRPSKELCGFEKTKLLSPGESQRIEFCINADDLAAYDDTGILGEKSVWVIEKGTYKLLLGNSSASTAEVGEYTESENRTVRKCHPISTSLEERLLADGNMEKLPVNSNAAEYDAVILPNVKNSISAEIASVRFSDLNKGEESVLKVLPGSGGIYVLTIDGDNSGKTEDLIDIAVNGVWADLKTDENNRALITLPMVTTELCIRAKCDNPQIYALEFEKQDTTVKISPDKENIVKAHNYYECSYGLQIRSEKENSATVDYLTWFWATGNNASYRLDVEEAGFYDIRFKCRYSGDTEKIGNVMGMAVSNISQPLTGAKLETVCDKDGNNIFAYTDPVTIELPKGIAYLKFIVEKRPFPDIAEIVIVKSKAAPVEREDNVERDDTQQGIGEANPQIEPDDGVREGILLRDVYKNPELMRAFLDQLSNRELATIVSGTSLNKTNHSNVGCNHPLFLRGVPATQTADGSDGLHQPGVITVKYSAPILYASSFDRELLKEVGNAIGEESLKCEVDIWLAPAINIFRNPCGGRNYTYASEDPYVSAVFAIEQIKAAQKQGVAAMIKHYCANNTEYERLKSNSRISERALREIYMKGFEIAVKEANPWAIMSSYNHVNGIKACEIEELITDVPRNEWHWDGVFATDWWNDSNHVRELKAGHDLKMATGDIEGVAQALDSGELTREKVYVSAERVLKMLMKITSVKQFLERE